MVCRELWSVMAMFSQNIESLDWVSAADKAAEARPSTFYPLGYCKFENFRKGFIFAKLRICNMHMGILPCRLLI